MIPVMPPRFNDALDRMLEDVRSLSLVTLADGTLECRVALHDSTSSSVRTQRADETRAAFVLRCLNADREVRAQQHRWERENTPHTHTGVAA